MAHSFSELSKKLVTLTHIKKKPSSINNIINYLQKLLICLSKQTNENK